MSNSKWSPVIVKTGLRSTLAVSLVQASTSEGRLVVVSHPQTSVLVVSPVCESPASGKVGNADKGVTNLTKPKDGPIQGHEPGHESGHADLPTLFWVCSKFQTLPRSPRRANFHKPSHSLESGCTHTHARTHTHIYTHTHTNTPSHTLFFYGKKENAKHPAGHEAFPMLA